MIAIFNKENIVKSITYTIVGSTIGATAKLGVHFAGRVFCDAKFGVNGYALTAAIGTIQLIASGLLISKLMQFSTKDRPKLNRMVHIMTLSVVSGCLVGLSNLAARANLLATPLTLAGGASLAAANFLILFGIGKLAKK